MTAPSSPSSPSSPPSRSVAGSGRPAPLPTPSPVDRLRASPAGRTTVARAKRILRSVGVATASQRPGPELLVIGAKRGGTTSLWKYLHRHPSMLSTFPRAENIKGTYFFDENWHRGEAWYRSHFPTRARRALAARRLGHPPATFEASPYYLYHPHAPARARQVVPDALIVAVLRDPVERAFSHWKERRNHTEELGFEAALEAEEVRTAGVEAAMVADPDLISFAHRHQTYLDQGRYAPMLSRWFDAYGRDRVIVTAAEDFYADPQGFCDLITDRLDLPRHDLGRPEPFNAEPSADMAPATRRHLIQTLAPDMEAVERLLGRTMPWSHHTA